MNNSYVHRLGKSERRSLCKGTEGRLENTSEGVSDHPLNSEAQGDIRMALLCDTQKNFVQRKYTEFLAYGRSIKSAHVEEVL